MLFYGLLLIILKFSDGLIEVNHPRVSRQAGSGYCKNPSGQLGICTNIRNCHALNELLITRSKDPAVALFLRGSLCGRENEYPKVCCPGYVTMTTSNPITSTMRPTTSTPRPINPSTRPNYSNTRPSSSSKQPVQSNTTPKNTPKEDFSKCGKSTKKTTRIIAGKNATLGDWPWMVALGYVTDKRTELEFKCGASLISNVWVVTAAHCVTNLGNFALTTARVGDLDLSDTGDDSATPIDVPIEIIFVHPEYSPNPIINDIALIRLRYPVTFTNLIRPICILSEDLHRSEGFYAKKLPFIIGWGATEWRGPTTNILQEAQVEIVNNKECTQKYSDKRFAIINERVLCAGKNGKDTCQGDSGGPLIIPVRTTYYLAGIVSFGIGCADSKYPGVYTRVAQFSDWIISTTGI